MHLHRIRPAAVMLAILTVGCNRNPDGANSPSTPAEPAKVTAATAGKPAKAPARAVGKPAKGVDKPSSQPSTKLVD